MKKIKMLVTCKAYLNNKLLDFEKGKKYEVDYFVFNSFIKSRRAVSLEDKAEEVTEVEELVQLDDEQETEEAEEEISKEINFTTMTKEKLKEYCKKAGIPLKGNPSNETIINKINEVKNG